MTLSKAKLFHGDTGGATTVEWVLMLCVIGLPTVSFLLYVALPTLADYYRMVVFLETLPFP